MRILLTCVGTRDPYWMEESDSEGHKKTVIYNNLPSSYENKPGLKNGPVLSFISALQPPPESGDKMYLFSTAPGEQVREPTQRGGEELARLLQHKYNAKIYHWPLTGINPVDFTQLVSAMREKVLQVLEENRKLKADYIVNVAPGTPQMQAVWYILVNAGVLKARLARPGERGIEEVSITPLFEEEIKKLGQEVLASFSFKAAAQIFSGAEGLSKRTVDPSRATKANIAGGLCAAYHAWSMFDYPQACKTLKEVLMKYEGVFRQPPLSSIRNLIDSQVKMLEELASETVPPETKAIDLYHSARMRAEEGDYTGCVWRCAAAYEHVAVERALQYIETQTGIRPSRQKFDRILERLGTLKGKTHVEELRRQLKEAFPRGLPRYLNVGSAFLILQRGNQQFRGQLGKELKWLADLRNKMIHRSRPVNEDEANRGLKVARRVIIEQFTSRDKDINVKIDRYPLSAEAVRRIKDLLAVLL